MRVRALRRSVITSMEMYGQFLKAIARKMNEIRKMMSIVRYPRKAGVYGGNRDGIRKIVASASSNGWGNWKRRNGE
jgi:hypothetical protein